MASIRKYLVDLVAKNLRVPSGVSGYIVAQMIKKNNRTLIERTVTLLQIQPQDHVLEVGFGMGVGLKHALDKVQNGKIYGIEKSPQMVDYCQKHFKKFIMDGQLEVKEGVVENIPFPDEKFDKIFHTNCYYFWPDVFKGTQELKRVLKPGGHMITSLNPHILKVMKEKGFTKYGETDPECYTSALDESGFVNVRRIQKPSSQFLSICCEKEK